MRTILWLLACTQASVIAVGTTLPEKQTMVLGLVGILLAVAGLCKKTPEVKQEGSEKITYLLGMLKKYESASLTDELTGLLNRRGGETSIIKLLARSRRQGSPTSFILIDLDHFKTVNDTKGHQTGDIVLCTVSRAVAASLRQCDLSIRWGGEELLAVLPDTPLDGALKVAEKLREVIEDLVFEDDLKITASLGVAEADPGNEMHTVLAKADMNLYISKAKGRNCVTPSRDEKKPLH